MTTPATHTPAAHTNGHQIGARQQLASYRILSGERLIFGQRIDGHVRLVGAPAAGTGRSYVIERELELDGYAALQALLADYLDQASRHRSIPAADSPIDRYITSLP